MVLQGVCEQLERDIRVWNHKKYLHHPVLVKEDKYLVQFRRWFSQFYSPSSPTLGSLRDSTMDCWDIRCAEMDSYELPRVVPDTYPVLRWTAMNYPVLYRTPTLC
ncbi:nvd [Cordylochernes scorpioides]|uniref:Nvd n=1 Tax=Cordylochernes scorpioides TaxID=51811 RepID=A0ABY6LU25_9ARAC|nr:nvd [Cordylochernes scorpioides]